MSRDSLYADAHDSISDFTFDERVAAVFPDMIRRSVPGYQTVIAMTGVLAGRYATPNSNCYDLGCSLGASSFAMSSQLDQPGCEIIAVDNSPAMLEQCQATLANQPGSERVSLVCADLLDVNLTNASVVVLNYTLQFVDASLRDKLIEDIYAGMQPGGVLLLSEKIRFDDSDTDQRMTAMHHAFKAANGYSELEISQKRTALENVLVPETLQVHQQRLANAGFTPVDAWFQCFNFVSLVAYKPAHKPAHKPS